VKKSLVIGLLALGLSALSQQQAAAWTKFNFSVGLNLSWESGNNNFLWGLFRDGQAPGYPTDVLGYPHQFANQGYYPMYMHYPVAEYAAAQSLPAPRHYQTPEPPRQNAPQTTWYQNSNTHQPVGYHYPSVNPYYQTPSYYPSWGHYGGHQVPSYWYGY
jgi:hypothetical protein